MLTIKPQPLTREAFAPFGDVIQIEGSNHFEINSGYTTRVHDLIDIQLGGESARAQFSFFLGRPRPLEIKMLEKHPLGSQAFYPIEDKRWLVVVASAPEPESVCAFWASGRQGVNYHQNVWHHPLLVIEPQQFVIIDRGGDGHNCDEVELVTSVLIQQPKV
ncbi:MAG: ureidoglycolate lyase [Litoricola sp.]|jgi:ureidoglycolate lyase|nr:ureidoglycolate lyase [Litorivicinus sp.]